MWQYSLISLEIPNLIKNMIKICFENDQNIEQNWIDGVVACEGVLMVTMGNSYLVSQNIRKYFLLHVG